MRQVVGISDLKVSNKKEDILVTYSLGSCVGLSLYDPVNTIGGLIHCMLPLSKTNREKAVKTPWMFVDSGVVAMLEALFAMGASKKDLIANVAGGASMLDDQKLFRIGEKNHAIVRKILWKNNILINAEDVGGTLSRTVLLNMSTGKTHVRSEGREFCLGG